jgi:hypothetical protein
MAMQDLQVRTEFSSYAEMAEESDRYVRELETWMEDHGPGSKRPWPAHNISNKQRRLAWDLKAREIFLRGASRDAGEAA